MSHFSNDFGDAGDPAQNFAKAAEYIRKLLVGGPHQFARPTIPPPESIRRLVTEKNVHALDAVDFVAQVTDARVRGTNCEFDREDKSITVELLAAEPFDRFELLRIQRALDQSMPPDIRAYVVGWRRV